MKGLKAIVLDVDGVLTDGSVWWGPNGEEWKRFSFADIMGVSLAMKAGITVALVSGEDSPLVDRFAAKMGIIDVEKNCKHKAQALRLIAQRRGLQSRLNRRWFGFKHAELYDERRDGGQHLHSDHHGNER